MGVTISTHNGSAVAREHNIRNPKVTGKEGHINPNGIHETWIDEKPKDAYERLFGAAVEKYNDKQKRSDRKITDYYRQICGDKKKHAVYEMIIAVGSGVDYTSGKLDEKTAKSILREFVDGWQERNPNLVLIGAYYHADEQGAPHAHLDYIPVADGYKRGLETQSALVKALEQQGFSKDGKETAQIQWERRENAYLEKLCQSRGIEVDHPLIEGRKHIETELYKATQELEFEDRINDDLKFRNQLLTDENNKLERKIKDLEFWERFHQEGIEELEQEEERLVKHQDRINEEIATKWEKLEEMHGEMSIKAKALEKSIADYEQATAQYSDKLNRVVEERQDLLYHIVKFCDKIQVNIGGVVRSVWEHFKNADNKPYSIDLLKEVYELESRFKKEQQQAQQRTKLNEKHH